MGRDAFTCCPERCKEVLSIWNSFHSQLREKTKGIKGLIHGFDERGERARAVHAGKVFARKAVWLKFTAVYADNSVSRI